MAIEVPTTNKRELRLCSLLLGLGMYVLKVLKRAFFFFSIVTSAPPCLIVFLS
uniref:Uncharacterized protein n=1 Tax=Utricularia reniformis TaxID=192314 RepID=A0A1Y0B429_9LAMI|nr:hypothetical protein AEK19_MT1985 [Utricularia reniformis]ART32148.1 hypothetical protein AEK19_MT1985 [Utricularia reniformis]